MNVGPGGSTKPESPQRSMTSTGNAGPSTTMLADLEGTATDNAQGAEPVDDCAPWEESVS